MLSKIISGLLATVPMTIVMSGLYKKLPNAQKNPLPPRTISMNIAQDLKVRKYFNESERLIITICAHFAYGAFVGALYPVSDDKIERGVSEQKHSIGYALMVWAANYLILLPALKLYRPITKDTGKRVALMVCAHVVWGSSFGLCNRFFRNKYANQLS